MIYCKMYSNRGQKFDADFMQSQSVWTCSMWLWSRLRNHYLYKTMWILWQFFQRILVYPLLYWLHVVSFTSFFLNILLLHAFRSPSTCMTRSKSDLDFLNLFISTPVKAEERSKSIWQPNIFFINNFQLNKICWVVTNYNL